MICPHCYAVVPANRPLHFCTPFAPTTGEYWEARAKLKSYGRKTWRLRLWWTKRMGWRKAGLRHPRWGSRLISPIVEECDAALSRRIKRDLGLA